MLFIFAFPGLSRVWGFRHRLGLGGVSDPLQQYRAGDPVSSVSLVSLSRIVEAAYGIKEHSV